VCVCVCVCVCGRGGGGGAWLYVVDGNWDKMGENKAFYTRFYFPHHEITSLSPSLCFFLFFFFPSFFLKPSLSLSVSPISVSAARGSCQNNRPRRYESPPPSAPRCSTRHSPAEGSEHARGHGRSSAREATCGYVTRLVFREEKGGEGEKKKRRERGQRNDGEAVEEKERRRRGGEEGNVFKCLFLYHCGAFYDKIKKKNDDICTIIIKY